MTPIVTSASPKSGSNFQDLSRLAPLLVGLFNPQMGAAAANTYRDLQQQDYEKKQREAEIARQESYRQWQEALQQKQFELEKQQADWKRQMEENAVKQEQDRYTQSLIDITPEMFKGTPYEGVYTKPMTIPRVEFEGLINKDAVNDLNTQKVQNSLDVALQKLEVQQQGLNLQQQRINNQQAYNLGRLNNEAERNDIYANKGNGSGGQHIKQNQAEAYNKYYSLMNQYKSPRDFLGDLQRNRGALVTQMGADNYDKLIKNVMAYDGINAQRTGLTWSNVGFRPGMSSPMRTVLTGQPQTSITKPTSKPKGHGKIVQTGTYNGKKVVKYEDGTIQYQN